MSKRPSSASLPDAKRISLQEGPLELADKYKAMNSRIDNVIQALRLAETSGTPLLAVALHKIFTCAPPEACLRETPALDTCQKMVEENVTLREALKKSIDQGNYDDVISLPILQAEGNISDDPSLEANRSQADRELHAVFQAFSIPYIDGFQRALLTTIDNYYAASGYNPTVSIIQSSGTGKSRGVEQVAQIRFTFLFNLRRRVKHFTYPPPDDSIRDFFISGVTSMTDGQIQRRYAIFLHCLFNQAHKKLLAVGSQERPPIAKWWYNLLNFHASEYKPGLQREAFYLDITHEAQGLLTGTKLTGSDSLELLRTSCNRFIACLREHYRHDDPSTIPRVACILAFDEAQELALDPVGPQTRSCFHNLGTVLKGIGSHGVFSVFLSTNSNLRSLPPPTYLHPSFRQTSAASPLLHPPITELPFDVFARDLYTELCESPLQPTRSLPQSMSKRSDSGARDPLAQRSQSVPPYTCHTRDTQPPRPPSLPNSQQPVRLPLSATCTVDVMARFGRSMWYTLLKNGYLSIIDLARAKLNPTCNFFADEDAKLACLGIRIGLDFDASRETGRRKELQLVESYMRVVFAVPEHREYMRAGTPSEPILAEAAAQLLNGTRRLEEFAPDALCLAFQNGFLARAERGEMAARLLWTLAHDKVLRGREQFGFVQFHKPISVLDFLQKLFHEDHLSVICNARPVGDASGPTLSEAFKDAYIHFSHFMDAVDHSDIKLNQVYRLLLRGAALNCRRNQPSIDFLTPVLFGAPHITGISRSKTSVLQAQVENRNHPEDFLVDPNLAQSQENLPVLSIVHELGSSQSGVVSTNPARVTRSGQSPHKHHYQLVAYGCTSKTYGVIPSNRDHQYPMLLGSNLLMEDFPRHAQEESLQLLHELDPCFGLEQGNDRCRWFGRDVE